MKLGETIAIAVLALAAVFSGCGKSKTVVADATSVDPMAKAMAQIHEEPSIANLRAKAHSMGLQWVVRCDDTQPDGSEWLFYGIAWPDGTQFDDTKSKIMSWAAYGKTQQDAAAGLLMALSHYPNMRASEYHTSTAPHVSHKLMCPPVLEGD
jgi:hypothetical protein